MQLVFGSMIGGSTKTSPGRGLPIPGIAPRRGSTECSSGRSENASGSLTSRE